MLNLAIESAKKGGEILLEHFGKITSQEIEIKGKNNFVTYVDRLSEELIIETIKSQCADHDIYAEESGEHNIKSEYQWIIDPLDGTTNFIQGIPLFAVNIALVKNKDILLSVTFDPTRNELFYAEKGKGAFLNGKKISMTKRDSLASCVLATGIPYKAGQNVYEYIENFATFIQNCAGIRRMGSAAIDLAYLACGRFDGFWEYDLKPWDIIPGVLLVQEAGGICSDNKGSNNYWETGNIVASTPNIHKSMLEILNKN